MPDTQTAQSILVVDDEPMVVRVIMAHLQANGYDVRAASNGREALKQARAAPPDLVVLDLNMPEMNGWQVAHHLRSDARCRRTPIIMLSALIGEDGPQEEAEEADFMIGKPFQLRMLSEKVRELLDACTS